MSYVSNCLADIAMKSSQRAALEAEQRAFLRRGGKITEVPGVTANPPTLTQQQRIAAAVAEAEAGAKLSAWRGRDGRHNNRNAKRLKRETAE